MKNAKHYFKGFTLVELIIVITILAILAAIAFISFQNYSWNARDSNRLSTIKNIETGLELFTLKTSQFPTPDETKTYTWWTDWTSQINQGIIWENVVKIIDLSHIPLDPKDKTNYVYSTFWNSNKYYQVGINSENSELSFIPQASASSQSSIVKWNYRFDPTLPSLIVVENQALTNSWIFSPDVCFVMNHGNNNLNECRERKSEMILKNYDNSLVWYWDMETLTWNLLKDLSGNENNWTFSGNILPTSTWSHIGKWYYFSGTGLKTISQYSLIHTNKNLDFKNSQEFSVLIVINSEKTCPENIEQTNLYWETVLESSSDINTHSWAFAIGDSDYSNTNFNKGCFTSGSYLMTPGNYSIMRSNTPSNMWVWKMIAITLSYSKDGYKETSLYINGEKQGNVNDLFRKKISWVISNYPLNLWSRESGNWSYKWTIDDVKIYNRALSEEEIFQQTKIAWF